MAFVREESLEEIGKKIQSAHNKEAAKNSAVINGKTYKVIPLMAEDGLVVWENLISLLGPSIGVGADSFNHNEIMDGSPTTFSEAALALQRKLDGNQLVNYSQELFIGLKCDGEDVDWNTHFSANYGDWTQVMILAMKENFQTFFTESGFGLNLQAMISKVLPQPEPSEESKKSAV
jgi:hypothetical protein